MESFDLETETWHVEPDFPFVPIYAGRNVPWGNTFLSVGGTKGSGNNLDFIYMVMTEIRL